MRLHSLWLVLRILPFNFMDSHALLCFVILAAATTGKLTMSSVPVPQDGMTMRREGGHAGNNGEAQRCIAHSLQPRS